MKYSKVYLIIILALIPFLQCSKLKEAKPKLIVYISIDQMRADYLSDDLYGKYFSENGFKKLMKNGSFYTNCYHDHACTMTGPGHATLGTGAYAHRTGIVGNAFFDHSSAKFNYCVYDSTAHPTDIVVDTTRTSSSPHYLAISSFGDELKKHNSKSKVYGISLKDRAAILMSGKHSDGAYWYNSGNGHFMTSSYYHDKLPEWIIQFNQYRRDFFMNILKKGWQRKLEEKVYISELGKDDRPGEGDRSGMSTKFPHFLSPQRDSLDSRLFSNIRFTPYGDELLEHFAKEFIKKENLGTDEHTDLLCVSFSATDYIGHTYGPFSHEMLDQMIVLDSLISDFIIFLDKYIGKNNYILVVSADHGVAPLPEYIKSKGMSAGRISGEKVNKLISNIFKKYDPSNETTEKKYVWDILSNYIYLTPYGKKIYEKHQPDLLRELKKEIVAIEGIETLYSAEEIQNFTGDNKLERRIKQSYYQTRSGDFYILVKPYYFFGYPGSSTGTTHGTPYDYDAHVPLIIYGAGVEPRVVEDTVGTADIAVTLGTYVGMDISSDRDGKNLGNRK